MMNIQAQKPPKERALIAAMASRAPVPAYDISNPIPLMLGRGSAEFTVKTQAPDEDSSVAKVTQDPSSVAKGCQRVGAMIR